MPPAFWWSLAAVALFALELATASFFFLWIGAGAALTAVVSFFVPVDWIQYSVFAVSSVLLVALSRPWARRFSAKPGRPANVDALVGREGTVTKVERSRPREGYVKVDGELWRAAALGSGPLKAHAKVEVVEVRSNQLVVKPL